MPAGGACLLDSNILLRISKSDDPQHAAIRNALRVLLVREERLTAKDVEQLVERRETVPEATAVEVAAVDLSCFDQLLEDREVWSGDSTGSESDVVGAVAGVAFASIP